MFFLSFLSYNYQNNDAAATCIIIWLNCGEYLIEELIKLNNIWGSVCLLCTGPIEAKDIMLI